ncbi:MAG: universal stress protein [Alphaproteobacteria bacterium]|nr:universal stress protein [Alphaproteobacteria bacterium]
MIKSILVTLDDSESSFSAKKLGVALAKDHKASVTGIGVLDQPWIAAPEAIPLGGAAFKVELDEKLLQDARRRVHKLEKEFTAFCNAENVDSSIIDATGVPSYEIEYFALEHDLLIIGKDANFHFTSTEDTGVSVKQIIRDNPLPIIVTSPTIPYEKSSSVLIAFDGTFASSRALHMAILVGILKGKEVHIAHANPDEKEAKNIVETAIKLCANHGIKAKGHPLASSEKPANAILKLSEGVKPCLIVMGAFGHAGISYLFMGSCAKTLLRTTNIPLFIYH